MAVSGSAARITVIAGFFVFTLAGGPAMVHAASLTPASDRSIDLVTLAHVEFRNGFPSHAGKGAWIGFGVGVLVGVGHSMFLANSGAIVPPLSLPLSYGSVGAVFGTLIASQKSRERSSHLPPEPQAPKVVDPPVRVGVQLGAPSVPLTVGVRVSF